MSLQQDLLRKIRTGKSVAEISRILDMRKNTVQAMIETLVHQGKIKQIDCHEGCNSCPMSGSCPVPSSGREKLYIVLENEDQDD